MEHFDTPCGKFNRAVNKAIDAGLKVENWDTTTTYQPDVLKSEKYAVRISLPERVNDPLPTTLAIAISRTRIVMADGSYSMPGRFRTFAMYGSKKIAANSYPFYISLMIQELADKEERLAREQAAD